MKMKMIVLRETKHPKNEFELAGAGDDSGPKLSPFTLSVDETDEQQRRALRKDKSAITAPSMPMLLIRAIRKTDGGPELRPPGENWGLAAVRAGSAGRPAGNGVTVAVLDSGIDATHPAFSGVQLVQKNFTEESPDDIDGHGTHCAGTIFGRDVDGLRIGIAQGISRALIGKVVGSAGASTEQVVKAISWAQQEGAHVISMSLGMDFVGYQRTLQDKYHLPELEATSIALAGYRDNVRLFDRISAATSSRAAMAGSAVVVAAAGNESKRPDYAITVSPPAAAEHFLSVGAIAPGEPGGPPFAIAPFSNEGAMFAAPGVDIWSAKLGGGLTAMSGTSMATPHVAGVAALWVENLLGHQPFTAARVIELMIEHRVTLTPHISEFDVRHGLVQAP